MIKKVLGVLLLLSIGFAQDYWFSAEWLRVLYYEKTGSGYKSLASGTGFFVSPQGQSDPAAEYEAELALVHQDNTEFKNKFPLRYKYIARQNNLAYKPTAAISNDIANVVLAYPNRYMSNPASMFGHLFFVLETKQGMLDSRLLHFAADTRGTPMNLEYAYKGLTGNFSGYFAKETYYRKIKDYNYTEDREVLYYDITLTPEQLTDLQLHYIEVQNISFPYYFMDGNCAYFLGKFLNVVTGEDIIRRKIYLLPADVINELGAHELLVKERARVSATKAFNELYNDLSWAQKSKVSRLFREPGETVNADAETLRAFLLVSEYIINTKSDYAGMIRQNRILAYQNLSEAGVPKVRQAIQTADETHKINTSSWQLDWYNDHYLNLEYAPIRFSGAENFADLALTDVRIFGLGLQSNFTEHPRYKFDLIDAANITQTNAVLSAISWSVKSQFSYQDSLSTNQEAYGGYAFNLFNKSLLYVLAGGNFTNYDDLSERNLERLDLLSGAKIGWQQNIINNLKLTLTYEHIYKTDYQIAELTYKYRDLISKIALINSEYGSNGKVSVMYLF
ncbi:protein DUF4105 [Candidatus Termititenax spirochaetophilus]|uniref:Protein DUF4105 n=1 Tax=Candidatus Termititenax spirochaetophilus TaxID=2218522 RepID=A0A388T8H1_9BACT|nr:protein DUF4105 [Candidatus Termititenax spirochaetophilus]